MIAPGLNHHICESFPKSFLMLRGENVISALSLLISSLKYSPLNAKVLADKPCGNG